ncbi:hypothetical protein EMA8858_04057 [Emticicia aquatica]|uniref:Glycosyltransferase 2-like domain-containing protein n=1 Tax=Emticicia aquatica TaxID=1681835 RepID=A0ABN8F3B3_9BACT|nr:glycosyltransferase [Emticicia aquatica]CAH0997922.1 hypothetical protein EMA8858_04057 [Emticicia aquatica]
MATKEITTPLVSVIIPVLNGEKFIKRAIESVYAQNITPIQIIVIDGGSTDNTLNIVSNLGDSIVVVHQQGKGLAKARNQSMDFAEGQYLVYLDSDDIIPPQSFERILSTFDEFPETEFVFGKMQHFFEQGAYKASLDEESYLTPVMGAGLFKMSAVKKLGYFIEELNPCEDMEWLHRAKTTLHVKTLEDITLYKGRHENNLSSAGSFVYESMVRSMKTIIDRKRASNAN